MDKPLEGTCMVEIALNGVAFAEELVFFTRRLCERSEAEFGANLRWQVVIARTNERSVYVEVSGTSERASCFGRGTDADEMLAVRNAFACLS